MTGSNVDEEMFHVNGEWSPTLLRRISQHGQDNSPSPQLLPGMVD